MLDDYLFLDIETVSNKDLIDLLPTPEPPKNYKDPVKINNWITEAKAEQIMDKMPLDIDYAQIKCIGYAKGDEEPIVCIPQTEEVLKAVLQHICNLVFTQNYKFCGFNILAYDLPLLIRNCMKYNVKPYLSINFSKYSTDVYDIMLKLNHNGIVSYKFKRGLKQIAQIFGIENKYPDLDGSMVKDMDDLLTLEYNKNDIIICQKIMKKIEMYY